MATKKTKSTPAVDPLEKFQALRSEMNAALTERTAEVDGLLVALLAREHILLLGPPGTAKTMMVKLLTKVIAGCTTFTRLMTRFSVPEELFGPFSMKGLKEDTYRRVVTGKLPEANLAFLDEVFKANSSILNALLTIINERTYENGDETLNCPLESMVGASNELPESAELDALYDRFMLRFWTGYIADKSAFKDLLMAGDAELATSLSLDELHAAQAGVDEVVVPEEVVDLLIEVKCALEKTGFVASDRRWVKTLRVLQAHAWLCGRAEVNEDDLLILQHVLWKEPKDKGPLSRTIAQIANPLAHAATEVLDAMREVFRGLPIGQVIPDSRSSEVMGQFVDANAQFKAAAEKLKKLANGRRNAAAEEAVVKIEEMKKQAVRFATEMGLS